jgi:arylsulfatase A-like enzyme
LVNNINVTRGFGFDQGFDLFHYEAPEYPFGASEAVFSLALYKVLHRLEERLSGGGPVERYYQPASVVLDHARTWLELHRGQRSVLFVHLMEPHDPYFVHVETPAGVQSRDGYARATNPIPDPGEAAELRRRYAGEVQHLDQQLGVFLNQVKAAGLYQDLTLVLTSDHGEEFFEHGGWWHGDSLHGEQTHVPLWIKLPGQALGGTEATWRVRTLDVAPTLATLAGVSPPSAWEGKDLLGPAERSALTGTNLPPATPPNASPATSCRIGRAHPLDRVVVQEEDFEGNVLWGVRTQGVAWLRARPGGTRPHPERALYDTVADPGERSDLVASGASLCSTFPDDWGRDLDAAYEQAITSARSGGITPQMAPGLSPVERARLCALGYLTGPDCP